MKLIYKSTNKEIDAIIGRLKGLSLAYQLVIDKAQRDVQIMDGSKSYTGLDEINSYIDLLDQEKEQWYYCNC